MARQLLCSRSALHRLTSGQVQKPDKAIVLALRDAAERKNPTGVATEEYLRNLLQRVSDEDTYIDAEPATTVPAHSEAATGGIGTQSVAPVPPVDGDRRNGSAAADAPWPVEELQRHLDRGRYEHAVGMLDHAGGKAPAKEAAAAIQACRGHGLTEAADTLLRAVGMRSEEICMAVIGHLLDVENFEDARALVRIRCN